MVEMLSYIFRSLKTSENSIKAIKAIKTTLRNQARINRTVATFALVVAAYAIALEVHTYEQIKKIQNLDNEIKELKRMKGE
jgi:cell division protein FtsL